jgi:hypothetical protein
MFEKLWIFVTFHGAWDLFLYLSNLLEYVDMTGDVGGRTAITF